MNKLIDVIWADIKRQIVDIYMQMFDVCIQIDSYFDKQVDGQILVQMNRWIPASAKDSGLFSSNSLSFCISDWYSRSIVSLGSLTNISLYHTQ